MATVFDLGLLQEFQIIFGWLLVFVLVYAALEMTKVLGTNKGLHAITAFAAATLFSLSPRAVAIVTGFAPWFVVMLLVFMFILVGVRFFFGAEGDQLLLNILGKSQAAWWVFLPVVIILGVLISSTLGPGLTPGSENVEEVDTTDTSTATSDWRTNVVNTLFHPKILGAGVLLLISMFTIMNLCSTRLS